MQLEKLEDIIKMISASMTSPPLHREVKDGALLSSSIPRTLGN